LRSVDEVFDLLIGECWIPDEDEALYRLRIWHLIALALALEPSADFDGAGCEFYAVDHGPHLNRVCAQDALHGLWLIVFSHFGGGLRTFEYNDAAVMMITKIVATITPAYLIIVVSFYGLSIYNLRAQDISAPA
jgi:hypothetical protein